MFRLPLIAMASLAFRAQGQCSILMASNNAYKQRAFVTLDGLRGVAASVIVVSHLSYFVPSLPLETNLAVDFFFVLSGFVLANAYGEALRRIAQ
jgi:peptidoglycan/LPS O-acetylase OafA/YrhL